MGGRILITESLKRKVLCSLHTVHQGMDGKRTHANDLIYWPGMNQSIWNFTENFSICATIAPSQPRESIKITPNLEWPFQQRVMNIFHVWHITYLACVDRLTCWLVFFHLKPGHTTTSKLMSVIICSKYMALQTNSVPTTAQHISGVPSDIVCEAETILCSPI